MIKTVKYVNYAILLVTPIIKNALLIRTLNAHCNKFVNFIYVIIQITRHKTILKIFLVRI